MINAKERMTNWLEARGVEASNEEVELVKKTIGYVFADEDFTSKENFNWYIPGGFATTSESSEGQGGGQGGSDDPGQSEIEVKQESDAWTYVYNEATFNESLENGGLAKYYEKYPAEDLESTTGAGNATFNDRVYVGSLDNSNEVVEFKASWEETSQKLTKVDDDTVIYYMKRVDEQGNQYEIIAGEDWTLYTDAALETEAGHVFHVTRMKFDGFEHTYNAAVNAPGSTLPWIVVNFDGETANNVEFEYNETAIPAQWDHAINWGIVPASTFATEFDETKLKMYITE